jgi:Zn-dependent metalloprotease
MNEKENGYYSTRKYRLKCCTFLPDSILKKMILEGDEEQRNSAISNLQLSAGFRAARQLTADLPRMVTALSGQTAKNRTIYTMRNRCNQWNLPGDPVMHEGDDPSGQDEDTQKCYRSAGDVFDFFKEQFGRISIDDNAYPLNLSVHFCTKYDNAFWTPWSLSWAFGDGGGGFFKAGRMTDASVVFHEYQHGVTHYTSKFKYEDEAGGLNESMSDVFSAICEQKINDQSFEKASWLIGEGMIVDQIGKALRSLEDPGNTSKTHRWDEQIQHYDNFDPSMDPHVCSGIPNKAFYLVCKDIGENSWDKPGKIWYKALTSGVRPCCTFKEFADLTVNWAKTLYGNNEQKAVQNAWSQVGVKAGPITTKELFMPPAQFR